MKILSTLLLIAAAGFQAPPLDSQVVLERYATRLLSAASPKVLVFSYSVSQAGPHDIEETHRIYRSGDLVRDETLLVDGTKKKTIRIARYRNRYTLENLAPRLTQYSFLFERAVRSGSGVQYVYQAVPTGAGGAFIIDGMSIDGKSFLPAELRFHAAGAGVLGKGVVAFMRAGDYWLPLSASVEVTINGKPARERITFSNYAFPKSLPRSTFQSPRPLPAAILPTF